MRILIFDERQAEREAMVSALAKTSHAVRVATDAKTLDVLMNQDAPEAVIVSCRERAPTHIVRAVCHAHPSCFVVVGIDAGAEVEPLLAAGAHDFFRRPFIAEEILARLDAPSRYRHLARANSGADLTRLRSWKDMGKRVAEDLAILAGKSLGEPRELTSALPADARGATIAMSISERESEVRVAVVTDEKGERWLAKRLLSDSKATPTMTDDMMRELANLAGAAVKRSMTAEKIVMTTGLPKTGLPTATDGDSCRGWLLSDDIFLALVVESRMRQNRRIVATHLEEGMILVRDLRNDAGTLLATAGTRLTSSTAERVGRLLGERFVVEVADAA